MLIPPATEPLTVQNVKDHLRIVASGDDVLIELWIRAARTYAQDISNRLFITQTWEFSFPRFPVRNSSLLLPVGPVQSIGAIGYYDTAGAVQSYGTFGGSPAIWDKFALLANDDRPRIALKPLQDWPAVFQPLENAVTVTVTAGYGDDAEDVPGTYLAGMLLLVGHFYENRETVVVNEQNINAIEIPLGIRDLLATPNAG